MSGRGRCFRFAARLTSLCGGVLQRQRHRRGFNVALHCISTLNGFTAIKEFIRRSVEKDSDQRHLSVVGSLEGEQQHAARSSCVMLHCHLILDIEQAEGFLRKQASTYLALFALSCGEFAASVDHSRLVLRDSGDASNVRSTDAGLWIMRGLGWAAIGECALRWCASSDRSAGHGHLLRRHFGSARSCDPKYPGLLGADVVQVLARAEDAFVERFLESSLMVG